MGPQNAILVPVQCIRLWNFGDMPPNACLWPNSRTTERTGRCETACNVPRGRVIGVLTLTPYDFWRRTHAMHHAGSGHLERRGLGDVDTLTVREYLALSFGAAYAIASTGTRASCSASGPRTCLF